MSTSPTSTPARIGDPNGKTKHVGLLQGIFVLFACAILSILWAFYAGQIVGQEFSPATFSVRSFKYTRVPGTKFHLSSPIYGSTNSVASISKSVLRHLKTYPLSPMDWHPVTARQGGRMDFYPAAILTQQLQLQNSGQNPFWDSWSNVHPDRAAILWPAVQELCMQNEYFLAGQLLENARGVRNVQELEQAVQALAKPLRSSDAGN